MIGAYIIMLIELSVMDYFGSQTDVSISRTVKLFF